MSVHTEIEIAASPEQVRKVFLDFENWPLVKNDLLRTCTRNPPTKSDPVEAGEKLTMNMRGVTCQVTVLENSERQFRWRGDLFYVLSGEHIFIFEPSTKNPGGTRFVNSEVFYRLNVILMKILPPVEMFQSFCHDLKRRVEELKAKGAL
ncbi:hypothetical protein B0O99DRAFT_680038 [Bisporella sp. PMI_857]|nr:hypothetical protein B0O99DRAFT_680038 [Bisporella sp. PMI_857]